MGSSIERYPHSRLPTLEQLMYPGNAKAGPYLSRRQSGYKKADKIAKDPAWLPATTPKNDKFPLCSRKRTELAVNQDKSIDLGRMADPALRARCLVALTSTSLG